MVKKYSYMAILILCAISCNKKGASALDLFDECPTITLKEKTIKINNDNHAYIEGIFANDSNIITIDIYDGKSYNLFNKKEELLCKRFGEIGEGPNEIPMGCTGYLQSNCFYVFDDQVKMIAKYDLNSLLNDSTYSITPLIKYDINEAQISKIVPLNDSIFIALGTYKDKYQYFIFNAQAKILDYAIELYNYNNSDYNTFHKFLSNQGSLIKHPTKNKFVGSIRFSSNIDFFEIVDTKIVPIKNYHLGNPIYETIQQSIYNRVIPTDKTINGYKDLCATEEYVYALYSNQKFYDESYCSSTILVYNWDGEAIKKIKLLHKALYIAADKKTLYIVTQEESGEFAIKAYDL